MAINSNRESPRIPLIRSRRQHLLARRGQRPSGALLRDEAQCDEFVADGVGGELGAAVGETLERRALGLAEDQEFEFLLFGHFCRLMSCTGSGRVWGYPPRCD